jgi:hypothetical protein
MGISLLSILGGLGSSIIGGLFANNSTNAITSAINKATATQKDEYNTGLGLLTPSITAGNTARDYQLGALGLPGGVSYSDALNAFRNSPGYKFALGQGENAVQTSAAANGSLFSGKTLKDLGTYASGLADQNFNNWFGNVGGIAGNGQNAAGSLIDLGRGTAGNLSSLALAGGANTAAGNSAMSSAINNGVGSLADLVKLFGGSGTAGGSSYAPSGNGGMNTGLGGLY